MGCGASSPAPIIAPITARGSLKGNALFEAAKEGKLSEMTRLLARTDAPDLLKHRSSVIEFERWSGVERNVPTDRLLQRVWKLHMAAPYSQATTSRDLDPGKGEWLCIAARKAGTDVLVVAAMAKRANVLRKTSSSSQAFESNGVFWYHWPAHSKWVFKTSKG